MAAATDDVGRFRFTLAIGAAIFAARFRLAMAARMRAFFLGIHGSFLLEV
jgi:hypothetical protein